MFPEWFLGSDRSGKFEIMAFFVAADEKQVRLRKPDGSEIEVPLDKLSDIDRSVVDQLSQQ